MKVTHAALQTLALTPRASCCIRPILAQLEHCGRATRANRFTTTPRLADPLRSPGLWMLTVLVNQRIMTWFLWHHCSWHSTPRHFCLPR